MSDIVCAQCGHGPHQLKQCHAISLMGSRCECKNFIRFEQAVVQLLVKLNNNLIVGLQDSSNKFGILLDVVKELHPDAMGAVLARYREIEAAMIEEQQAAANNSSEEASPNNVINFPTTPDPISAA